MVNADYDYDRRKMASAYLEPDKLPEGLAEIEKGLSDVQKVASLAKKAWGIVKGVEGDTKRLHKDQVRAIDDLEKKIEALTKLGKSKGVEAALKKIRVLKTKARSEPWQDALSVSGAFGHSMIAVNDILSGRTRSWLMKKRDTQEVKDLQEAYTRGLLHKHYAAVEKVRAEAETSKPLVREIFDIVRFADIILPYERGVLQDEIASAAEDWNGYVEILKTTSQYYNVLGSDVAEKAETLDVNAKEWLGSANNLVKVMKRVLYR